MTFIGLARFRLATKVTDQEFIAMEQPIREILKAQPGFIDRSLARAEDGHFLVTITWNSQASGGTWTEVSKGFEAVVRQHRMIDFSTMRMEFFETVI
jgi:heme-degrading monooxygenase HmoA